MKISPGTDVPIGFRPRIRVFGETLTALYITDEVGICVVLYRSSTMKKKEHPKVAAASDWIKWDRAAKAAEAQNE